MKGDCKKEMEDIKKVRAIKQAIVDAPLILITTKINSIWKKRSFSELRHLIIGM